MKKNKFFACFLIFLMILAPLSGHAQILTLDKMLSALNKSKSTSLQKLSLVEEYKGEIVEGSGKVKDVLKSFGAENKAMVYLQKSFGDKKYEIVLVVDRDTVEDIKKGKKIRFEGAFAGMSFETLRFENAEIISASGAWWWPF